jgi:hypothetical protein
LHLVPQLENQKAMVAVLEAAQNRVDLLVDLAQLGKQAEALHQVRIKM